MRSARRRIGLVAIGCVSLAGLLATAVPTVSADAKNESGRWKREGDVCVFAPEEDGVDQCAYYNPGRFKGGNGEEDCYYDPDDWGYDQCEP